MSFTFLGFLVFVVLATIKAVVKTGVEYSWFKACLPLLIGLALDVLIVIGFLLFFLLAPLFTAGVMV